MQAQWERLKCLYGQPGGQQPLQVAGSDFDSDGLRVSIPPALHSVMDADDKSRLAVRARCNTGQRSWVQVHCLQALTT